MNTKSTSIQTYFQRMLLSYNHAQFQCKNLTSNEACTTYIFHKKQMLPWYLCNLFLEIECFPTCFHLGITLANEKHSLILRKCWYCLQSNVIAQSTNYTSTMFPEQCKIFSVSIFANFSTQSIDNFPSKTL